MSKPVYDNVLVNKFEISICCQLPPIRQVYFWTSRIKFFKECWGALHTLFEIIKGLPLIYAYITHLQETREWAVAAWRKMANEGADNYLRKYNLRK
jgi:hypothetical protein